MPGALNLVKTRFYVHYKRRMIIDRNETLFATLEDTLAFMLFRRLCFVARYQKCGLHKQLASRLVLQPLPKAVSQLFDLCGFLHRIRR